MKRNDEGREGVRRLAKTVVRLLKEQAGAPSQERAWQYHVGNCIYLACGQDCSDDAGHAFCARVLELTAARSEEFWMFCRNDMTDCIRRMKEGGFDCLDVGYGFEWTGSVSRLFELSIAGGIPTEGTLIFASGNTATTMVFHDGERVEVYDSSLSEIAAIRDIAPKDMDVVVRYPNEMGG